MESIITAMQPLIRICFLLFCCHAAVQAQVKKQPAAAQSAAKKVVKSVPPAAPPSVPAAETFTRVSITTSFGTMIVKLYNKTPQHRDNFIKLVKEKFFDSLLFHRVIREFMIQGGDPGSKLAAPGQMLGTGDVGYTIPAEFDLSLIHI